MNVSLPALALVLAAGLPLSACAQQSNAAENGPPPEVRAQMQQARDTAKTAALNDLSAPTRAKVQSIIDDVNSGKQTDLRAASQQIDAALTPSESKAVLAERDKMMQAIHKNMPPRPDGAGPNGPGPNGAGPGGAPPNGGPPRGGMGRGGNDAGRFLLSLGVSREKMHELRQKQMQSQPAPQ